MKTPLFYFLILIPMILFSCGKKDHSLLNDKSGSYQMVLAKEYYYCKTEAYIEVEYDTFTIHFNEDKTGYAYGYGDTSNFKWNYRKTNKYTNPSEWVVDLEKLHLYNSRNRLESLYIFYVMDFDDNKERWHWPGDCWFALGPNPEYHNKEVYITKLQ